MIEDPYKGKWASIRGMTNFTESCNDQDITANRDRIKSQERWTLNVLDVGISDTVYNSNVKRKT